MYRTWCDWDAKNTAGREFRRALSHLTELTRVVSDSPERLYDMNAITSTADTIPAFERAYSVLQGIS